MPEEHAFFDASPQSTILEDGESLIWYNVTIHSRPVGMTSQAGISPLPDRV